jgi:hypothetical protein
MKFGLADLAGSLWTHAGTHRLSPLPFIFPFLFLTFPFLFVYLNSPKPYTSALFPASRLSFSSTRRNLSFQGDDWGHSFLLEPCNNQSPYVSFRF